VGLENVRPITNCSNLKLIDKRYGLGFTRYTTRDATQFRDAGPLPRCAGVILHKCVTVSKTRWKLCCARTARAATSPAGSMPGTGQAPPPRSQLKSPSLRSPSRSPRPASSPLAATSTATRQLPLDAAAVHSPSKLPLPPSEVSSEVYELEAVIAQRVAALEELKADIASLREQVGQQQKRQAAELHRGRERRVETLLAELVPLPDELQEPAPVVAPASLQAAAVPARVPSRALAPARMASPRPAAPARTVTPRTGRPTSVPLSVPSSRRAPTPATSRTPAVRKPVAVPRPPRPKEPETKLAPAAAALLASMHESKYSRFSGIKASAAAASAAAK
jgi:hypothetical protein